MTNRRTIRWVIAHFPVELFLRTAEKFKAELEKECPGEFDLEIHTLNTYVNKYGTHQEFRLTPPNIPGLEYDVTKFTALDGKEVTVTEVSKWSDLRQKWQSLFNGLREGDFEISQTQASIIGAHLHKNFHAIDLPFLFDDHDHVSRVLDGEIGDSLCQELVEQTDIRGLAFTYSGGYRVIGSQEGITDLTDLAKAKLLTHTAHSDQLFQNVGANTISKTVSDINDIADLSDNGAVETTYLRFAGKHVFKTEHSMFTTTILTGNKFWNTLTEKQQEAFKRVAKVVARAEREWSIQDGIDFETSATARGVNIITISDEDKQILKNAAVATYENLDQRGIDSDLVNQIIDKRTLH